MRLLVGWLCLLVANFSGCSTHPTAPSPAVVGKERVIAWPNDWSEHVGQRVTLEGAAANAKLGALLLGKESEIWIDGLDSWPEGFYSGGDKGKRLRVTGTVIKKGDLPVFVQKPGEFPSAGIPVKSEQELEKAKWRYLLKDAKWDVLE
jgi:hypothetical protein